MRPARTTALIASTPKNTITDAKAQRDTRKAKNEATEEKREASRELAEEKCDALTGDAKTACNNQAKAKNK